MRIPGKIVSGPHVGKTMVEAIRERRAHEMRLADRRVQWEMSMARIMAGTETARAMQSIIEVVPDEMAGKVAPIRGPFSWLNRASRGIMGGQ